MKKMLYQEMRALWCQQDSVYNSLKKAVWSLSNEDLSFKFLKISWCFGKNWQDLSEKKINSFNIKSHNYIRYIWIHSKPFNAHTSKSVIYVKKLELYLSHSNLISKHKLITLPRLQLLNVSIAICYSQCVIMTMTHGKIMFHEMNAL